MLGIYIHLPFCRVRCSYCAFAVSTNFAAETAYTDALVREIEADAEGEPADSVFLGGGTPSASAPEQLTRVMNAVRTGWQIQDESEITLEANPEDVSDESLQAWTREGINRLSVGIQTLDDVSLRALSRIHDSAGAVRALRLARPLVGSLSADLIIGLPGQTPSSFRESLLRVLDCGVDHVSLYMLDLEERTALETQVRTGRVLLPEEAAVEESYLAAVEMTADAGLAQYEISNFARPGHESRHNLKYWTLEPYRGYGVGAHSFDGRARWANAKSVPDYIERIASGDSAVSFREELAPGEQREELIFLSLRRAVGILYSDLTKLCGREGVSWLERGEAEGWLVRRGERVAFTPRGFLVSSELMSQLF